ARRGGGGRAGRVPAAVPVVGRLARLRPERRRLVVPTGAGRSVPGQGPVPGGALRRRRPPRGRPRRGAGAAPGPGRLARPPRRGHPRGVAGAVPALPVEGRPPPPLPGGARAPARPGARRPAPPPPGR